MILYCIHNFFFKNSLRFYKTKIATFTI